MNRDVFMVTSACMNDYGVYTRDEKWNQVLATLKNIKEQCPDSDIVLIESSRDPLPISLIAKLTDYACMYYQCAGDSNILAQSIELDPNQQVAKTFGELAAFNKFFCYLFTCKKTYRRCFKLSGRYQLNDTWTNNDYEQVDLMFKTPKNWRHSQEMSHVEQMVVDTKFWSWHWDLTPQVMDLFSKIQDATWQQLAKDGTITIIERILWDCLQTSNLQIRYAESMGVQGHYGQCGTFTQE